MQIETIEKKEPFYLNADFFAEILSRLIPNDKELDEILLENEENGGVCLSCDNVVGLTKSRFDIQITRKFVMKDVEGYVCNDCGEVVSFDLDVVMDIMTKLNKFKSERPSIDQLLSTSDSSSYRWCESMMCACAGAANCSGSLSDYLYTKRDWVVWKSKNRYKETEFNGVINSMEDRMTTIKAFVEYFNYPDKKAIFNLLKLSHARFGLSYAEGSQEAINKDKEDVVAFFKSKGIDVSISKGTHKGITFVKELDN